VTEKIIFLKILGVATPLRDGRPTPGVVAFVGTHKVTWRPVQGWTCRDCNEDTEWCSHVETIANLISFNITNDASIDATQLQNKEKMK
jgi:hypothetical protein